MNFNLLFFSDKNDYEKFLYKGYYVSEAGDKVPDFFAEGQNNGSVIK